MLSSSSRWVPLGLLILCAKESFGDGTLSNYIENSYGEVTDDFKKFIAVTHHLPTTQLIMILPAPATILSLTNRQFYYRRLY